MISVSAVQDNILRMLIDGSTFSVKELSEKLNIPPLLISTAVYSMGNKAPEWFNVKLINGETGEIALKPDCTDQANKLLFGGGVTAWQSLLDGEKYSRKIRLLTILCWLEFWAFLCILSIWIIKWMSE